MSGDVRAAVDKAFQFGIETTKGTIVAANRYTPTLGFMMQPETEEQEFTASGARQPTSMGRHKIWGSGTYEGVTDYNSLMYIASCLFADPTASQIGSLTAYRRQYRPGVRTSDNARKTLTIQPGDATAVDNYPYSQLTGLNMELGLAETKVNGKIVSQYPTFNQTKTSSPTSIPERPVLRGDINVYMDSSLAGIGTTLITEARRETLAIGDKFKEAWFHNRSNPSWGGTVELPYKGLFSFVTAHNAQSRGYLAALAANDWVFLRIEAQGQLLGNNGGTDVYELMQWDIAGKMKKPEEIGNDDGVQGYKYNVLSIENPDLGRAYQLDLINSRATL
jgi:hypothetical protein